MIADLGIGIRQSVETNIKGERVEFRERAVQAEVICAQKEAAVLLGVLQCKLISLEAERDRLLIVENLVKDVLEEVPCEDDCSSLRELRLSTRMKPTQ